MDEIIDYVMETPQNTNPNVLRSMLENLNGGSSESNNFVFTYDPATRMTNKTYAEIAEAMKNHKLVLCDIIIDNTYGGTYIVTRVFDDTTNSEYRITFAPEIMDYGEDTGLAAVFTYLYFNKDQDDDPDDLYFAQFSRFTISSSYIGH